MKILTCLVTIITRPPHTEVSVVSRCSGWRVLVILDKNEQKSGYLGSGRASITLLRERNSVSHVLSVEQEVQKKAMMWTH